MMKTTSALCLLLLAGCASAHTEVAPEPGPVIHTAAAAPRAGDTTRVVKVQPVRYTIVNGACHTADPMPVARRGPLDPPRSTIPNAGGPRSLAYIPNACPVTAGPLARKSVPASYPTETVPEPMPDP